MTRFSESIASLRPAGFSWTGWLGSGRGKIIVGGQLLRELSDYGDFNRWLRTDRARSIALAFDNNQVDVKRKPYAPGRSTAPTTSTSLP